MTMNAYGRYRGLRNASWHCLIDCHITSLPVSVSSIAASFDIGVYSFSRNAALLRRIGLAPLLDTAGFVYADPSAAMMIYFDDQAPRSDIRFTIAHELGHILLGHVGLYTPKGRFRVLNDPAQEQAADQFALRLLAPACALWELGLYTGPEIAAACDIPLEAARLRARRMQVLRRRDHWLSSDLERQLYAQLDLPRSPERDTPIDGQ